MKGRSVKIEGIPSIVWGDPSDRLYLYIHGQSGCKEEAAAFAGIAGRHGWQVLSFDLPGHGERGEEADSFDPWHVVPELSAMMREAKRRWKRIALYAGSIGAWFSMLGLAGEKLEQCLLVSPVLDMPGLILQMMQWAGVSEERLEREGRIPTSFGQTLSWEYLLYAREHPIAGWEVPTRILYGECDGLTAQSTAEAFARQFHCDLCVMSKGEHWFHTPEQLGFLHRWIRSAFGPDDWEYREIPDETGRF